MIKIGFNVPLQLTTPNVPSSTICSNLLGLTHSDCTWYGGTVQELQITLNSISCGGTSFTIGDHLTFSADEDVLAPITGTAEFGGYCHSAFYSTSIPIEAPLDSELVPLVEISGLSVVSTCNDLTLTSSDSTRVGDACSDLVRYQWLSPDCGDAANPENLLEIFNFIGSELTAPTLYIPKSDIVAIIQGASYATVSCHFQLNISNIFGHSALSLPFPVTFLGKIAPTFRFSNCPGTTYYRGATPSGSTAEMTTSDALVLALSFEYDEDSMSQCLEGVKVSSSLLDIQVLVHDAIVFPLFHKNIVYIF